MFIAIKINSHKGVLFTNLSTESVATFTYENDALKFAEGNNEVLIVDCSSGKIIKDVDGLQV